jgi:hypothetical protein
MITAWFVLNQCMIAQVVIRDSIDIDLSAERKQTLGFTDEVTLYAYYTYKACDASGTFELNGPCASYHQSASGGVSSNFSTVTVTIEVVVKDPGNYNFVITQHAICPTGCNGSSSNCSEFISVSDSKGRHWDSGRGPVNSLTVNLTFSTDCSSAETEPQAFDASTIERYEEGQLFYAGGGGLPYLVSGCIHTKEGDGGGTEIMPGMPWDLPESQREWVPLRNIELLPCLDVPNNRWYFKILNLRFAIFSSPCVQGYTDLKGCDNSLFTTQLTSPELYYTALRDLKWWIAATYAPYPRGSHAEQFAFSDAIRKHEDYHFVLDSAALAERINDGLRDIHAQQFPYSGECAIEAAAGARSFAKDKLTTEHDLATRQYDDPLDTIGEQIESHANEFAREEYRRIEGCLGDWKTLYHPEW